MRAAERDDESLYLFSPARLQRRGCPAHGGPARQSLFRHHQPGRRGTPRADGYDGLCGDIRAPYHALSPGDLRKARDGNRDWEGHGVALHDQQGRTIALTRLRGQVVALTFVSAICTEQCPLVGKGLSQVRHALGRAAAHLTIVAISVAPERDTPRTVRHFAALSGW